MNRDSKNVRQIKVSFLFILFPLILSFSFSSHPERFNTKHKPKGQPKQMAPKTETSTIGFRGVEVRPLQKKPPESSPSAPGEGAPDSDEHAAGENNDNRNKQDGEAKEEFRDRVSEPREVC